MRKRKFWTFKKSYNLKTPLLIGSGSPSIYEVGLYINRNYGIPVIPGHAIKGVFRSYLKEVNKEDLIFLEINKNLQKYIFLMLFLLSLGLVLIY